MRQDQFIIITKKKTYEERTIKKKKKKKKKSIYGTASKKDIQELREEGIDTQMIPWIEENNN